MKRAKKNAPQTHYGKERTTVKCAAGCHTTVTHGSCTIRCPELLPAKCPKCRQSPIMIGRSNYDIVVCRPCHNATEGAYISAGASMLEAIENWNFTYGGQDA